MKNKLTAARTLLILGLGVGLKSWWQTTSYVGDDTYHLIAEFAKGAHNAWYHAFREAIRDLASMAILLIIFFGEAKWRTPHTWWLSLIIMIGYYAPLWMGTPFAQKQSAPHATAEIIHLLMAVPSLIALLIAKKQFANTN